MSNAAFSFLHPDIQKAIWSMGWKELRPIQAQAIQSILQGDKHLIICAQTAGGKTEAAFLPIISKIAQNPQPSVQAIYVGPLKALINDQFARLEDLCRHMEIAVHRWHGDVPVNQKKKFRESPSGILLITPESLESNFINHGTHVARIYRNIEFVVIDELHSFLDNVRGVHLRSLLHRLSAATSRSPRMVGLSATLGDPDNGKVFLAPDDADAVQLIEDNAGKRNVKFGIKSYLKLPSEEEGGKRLDPKQALQVVESMDATSFFQQGTLEMVPLPREQEDSQIDELDEIAEDILHHLSQSTNLVFFNDKRTLEIVADRLHQKVKQRRLPIDPFVVHHGSVSKELRECAEEELKNPGATTALCSSTLEMGIDIGSVRAIGQVDPPWSVSSLVQRLGRSGRREGESAIMRFYIRESSPQPGSKLDNLLYPVLLKGIALARLMIAKWLEPADMDRMHLSTLIHQILSCLKQTGGMMAAHLYGILCQRGSFRQLSTDQFSLLLRGLAKNNLVEQTPQGELILALLGERITSSFDFYASFVANEEFSIRYGAEEIGKLPADAIPPAGETIILGGKRWKVEQVISISKVVEVTLSRGGKPPIFSGSGGEIHSRIFREMRAVLHDQDEPAYLDENSKILLQAARRFAAIIGLTKSDVLFKPKAVQWFPWIGTRGFRTLLLHAQAAGLECIPGQLSLTYPSINHEQFHRHLRSIADGYLRGDELAAHFQIKTFEKFDPFIPEDLLNFANGHDRLDIEGARQVAAETLTH